MVGRARTLCRSQTQEDDDMDYHKLNSIHVILCSRHENLIDENVFGNYMKLHANHLKVFVEHETRRFGNLEFLCGSDWKPLIDVSQLENVDPSDIETAYPKAVYVRDPTLWSEAEGDEIMARPASTADTGSEETEEIDAGYLRLRFCYRAGSLKDMFSIIYMPTSTTDELVRFNMNHIKVFAQNECGTAKDMEYFDGKQWNLLLQQDMDVFAKFRRVKNFVYMPSLTVRVPSKFEYTDEDDKIYEGMMTVVKSEVDPMERAIYNLLRKIKAEHCCSDSFWKYDVRRWVEDQAVPNSELLSVLLSRVGALDHIVMCLQTKGAWASLEREFNEFE
jgi:hypothetical protein